MARDSNWEGMLAAGALWSLAAIVSLESVAMGAQLLVWVPSAVAVASLFATPPRRWPTLLAVLAVFQFFTLWVVLGSAIAAIGFTLGNQAEAVVCGIAGVRVLGGRKGSPQRITQIAGIFAAAMLGSACGTMIALPFQPVETGTELAWRFMATVLGILAGAPSLLLLRQWAGFGDLRARVFSYEPKEYFGVVIAALSALGAIVLSTPLAGLMPLLLVAIVFTVIRYGQMGAAAGVLAYAGAATLVGLRIGTPVAGWDLEPMTAAMALQAQMLLMLASAMPIAAVLLSREQMRRQLHDQNRQLHDNITIMSLSESLAGIGRWRYDVRSGAQEWSPLMLELNGLPRSLAPDPGNVRDLLPDGGETLFGALAQHREDRTPYVFDYRIAPPGEADRVLRVNVTNEFSEADERTAVFAVAMDVTEQVRREETLLSAREQAITLARESQVLANTDALTGLANRRATFDWLDRLVRAAGETGEPLSLVIFDIDYFKRINDCFGHATGDEVLKKVARIARGVMRGDDLVGRIGGEEFVCLLPGMNAQRARSLAERLREAVAVGDKGDGLPVATISLGLALMRPGDDGASLLERADAALYEAKEAGRNQVRRAA